MLPQRLATWLSATRNGPRGKAPMSGGMVVGLKMPWRKSLNTIASDRLPAIRDFNRSRSLSEIGRLSSLSTLSMR